MGKLNLETGFTLVELLLIILVFIVLGFGGYYVYHSEHQGDNVTSSSSSSTVTYFSIPQWGVRAPYYGNLTLSYVMEQKNTVALFTSKQLLDLSSQCTASAGSGGGLSRYLGTASADSFFQDPSSQQQTVAQYAEGQPKDMVVHIGQYYYFFTHSEAACYGYSSTSLENLQQQTNTAVQSLISKLQTI